MRWRDSIVNRLGHAGIDAIGAIPEGGLVSRAIGDSVGWGGKVATQQGTKALKAIQEGAGIVSTGLGSEDTSRIGTLQTITGVVGLVPVLGQGAAFVSIGLDIIHMGLDISQCHSRNL